METPKELLTRPVSGCRDCPFFIEGADKAGCNLSRKSLPRPQMGNPANPPDWCLLRRAPVLVQLCGLATQETKKT